MRKRVLVNNYGPNEDNLKKAIQYAFHISRQENKSISILVPTLNNLDGPITNIFGDKLIKRLKKEEVTLYGTIKMNLLTDITVTKKQRNPIFLCLYTTSYTMNKIDSIGGIDYEIYLPWMESDVENYSKWNFEIIK